MKKAILFLFLFLFIVCFPLVVSAHGGVEKRAVNILVTLFQTPLSPLVGEQVNFAFILTDPAASKRLMSKSVRLVVTQTTTGDPSKDKIVFTKQMKSDSNGIITFSYIFPKTNYYDIDLEFGKPGDKVDTTGFLVQPRENLQMNVQFLEIIAVVSIILNFVVLLFGLRKLLRSLRS